MNILFDWNNAADDEQKVLQIFFSILSRFPLLSIS